MSVSRFYLWLITPALALALPAKGLTQLVPSHFTVGEGGTLIIASNQPTDLTPTRVAPIEPAPQSLPVPLASLRPSVSRPSVHPLTTLNGSRLTSYADSPAESLEPKRVYSLPDGPWGELEFYVTHLRVPKSFLPLYEIPSEQIVWHFPETDGGEIQQLLESIGFPTDIEGRPWTSWLDARRAAVGGSNLFPKPELVLALTAETRQKLAALLLRSHENVHVHTPHIIESGQPLEWFKNTGLNEETAKLAASLAYPASGGYAFSDLPLLISTLPNLSEQRAALRALSTTQAIVLRLKLGGESEISAISEYWAAGHKDKAILPIFESVSENPNVEYLDCAHLLPPTPRRLLYTFPDIGEAAFGLIPDCHWTALNFTRSQPMPLQTKRSVVIESFFESHDSLSPDEPLRFGDVIAFVKLESMSSSHMCVYIAGEIVFTKNGEGANSPWIFMRYGDMLAHYRHLFPRCQTVVYRSR